MTSLGPIFITDDWNDVAELRDHNEERRDFDPDGWAEHEIKVGIFLTDVLKIKVCIPNSKNHGMFISYLSIPVFIFCNIMLYISSRIGH